MTHREELFELHVQQRRQHLPAVGGGVLAVRPVAVKDAEEVGAGLAAIVAHLRGLMGGGGELVSLCRVAVSSPGRKLAS